MTTRNGPALFRAQTTANRLVCVGLDGVPSRMPAWLLERADEDVPERHPMFLFHKAIVDATYDVAGCFKPNSAFFEACGWRGMRALERLVAYIHDVAWHVPVIDDGKRGDIGPTNSAYGTGIFDIGGFDALTVHNYTGQEGLSTLLQRPDKLFFVLARTSNPGAREFQNLFVTDEQGGLAQEMLWQRVAKRVAEVWDIAYNNCGLVVGATYDDDLAWVRVGFGSDMPILSPGLGVQGGNLRAAAWAGRGNTTFNNSSGIIYSSNGPDFAEAARRTTIAMNEQLVAAQAANG
jgi:orotidine-5'-phosphate decarboxylase